MLLSLAWQAWNAGWASITCWHWPERPAPGRALARDESEDELGRKGEGKLNSGVERAEVTGEPGTLASCPSKRSFSHRKAATLFPRLRSEKVAPLQLKTRGLHNIDRTFYILFGKC